ncbi:muramidase family protein [Prosthecobacter fluviatilis]|uniref:LysM peptidoglycan-binding domain-containing protein n=1 Tax=Prosthecobacter fluviatilis TaxID=445931 RepID=A0ABW0KNK9_9BACT
MKTPRPASRALRFLVLAWSVLFTLPLTAVTNTFNQPPPPGYPASGALKQPSTKASRQSAAAIQAPVTRPQYPNTYPPPAGYTYPPPGYGTAPKPATTKSGKSATSGKSGTRSAPAKKPAAGPPPPPKVYGPTGDLSTQVTKIRESDRVQNIRIGELERDVSSIKRGGGKSSTRYDGGTDLAAHTTYIARPGDTLWRIATTHRVSVGEIQQLNRMTEEEVHVGQALLIPSPHRLDSPTTPASYTPPTPGGITPAPTSTVKVSAPVYYTVRKGDSLKGIALKHKMTIASLASANKIKDVNKIAVGQRLKIPGRTTTITVASKTPVPAQQSSDTIPLPGYGVPGAPPPPAAGLAPAATPPPGPPPAPTPIVAASPKAPDTTDSHRGILAYRVDSSDTIESIATQFTTTPDQIREMNRLTPGTPLKTGDEIMVPAMGAVSVGSR